MRDRQGGGRSEVDIVGSDAGPEESWFWQGHKYFIMFPRFYGLSVTSYGMVLSIILWGAKHPMWLAR